MIASTQTLDSYYSNAKVKLKSIFTLDLRFLGIARILMAVILLYDLVKRFLYLTLHYGPQSVLPQELLYEQFLKPGAFTFHLMFDATGWLYLIFGVKLICYLALLLGYRTTLSTFLSWLLLLSMHNANPLILNSGDPYLRILLFWAIFLPWGTWYSADSMKAKMKKPVQFFGIASIAFILQICLMYLFTGLLKKSPEWLSDGTAIHYALSLQQLAKPFGTWLLQFPELLKWMTFGTLFIETLAPILILFPKWNPVTKSIAIVLLISFHLGIYATMMIGTFSFVCIAGLIAIFPYFYFEKYFHSDDKTPVTESKSVLSQVKWIQSFQNYFLFSCIAVIFIWNLNSYFRIQILPKPIEYASYFLKIDQRWSMFAPAVAKNDGWYTFEAIMVDGSRMDLFQKDNMVISDSPDNWLFMYRNYARWRKYFENLYQKRNSDLYEAVSKSFIDHFSDEENRPVNLEIYYNLDWSNVGYPDFVEKIKIYDFKTGKCMHCNSKKTQ